MTRPEGPVVVVTGAYGSIGRSTMSCVTARSGQVVSVDQQRLPEAYAHLPLREVTVDLLDDAAAGAALGGMADLAPIQHVIAIAGGGDSEELSNADPATESLEVFERVVAANLHTAFVTIRHTVPLLRQATGDRSITLVSSINAMGGYAAPGYSAAKAGLDGLAKSLAPLLGADGVRINVVALGTVDTDNLRRLSQLSGRGGQLAATATKAPLRKVLTPDEVATCLVAVAFDMASLTGTCVILDNGQTLIR